MSALSVIVKKEVKDNLRDRRALTTALVMPFLGPLTLVAIFFAFQKAEEKTHAPHVPVLARENAPELVHFLEAQGVVVEDAPTAAGAAEALVRTAKADVVLRIPKDFGAHLREGTPAVVDVICDPSRQDALPTLNRVETLVAGYGKAVGSLRLVMRGVDPAVLEAVKSERVDVSAPGAEKALLLASLPLFLLMACFVSGLYVAIDITAGERERGSLESLLLNPVPTTTIVLAKVLSAIVFALVGMAVSLFAFSVVLQVVPFADIGIDLRLSPRTVGELALLFAPATCMAASLEIFVGTLSKNTKTAQASLGLIIVVPVIPGVLVSLFPQQPTAALCAIPAFGESVLGMRLLRGEEVHAVHWLASAGAELAIAAILVAVTARLFGARMLSS